MIEVGRVKLPVCSRGYSWQRARPLPPEGDPRKEFGDYRDYLIPNDTLSNRTYDPIEDEPTLFLRFAELEVTTASVVTFASLYGTLGVEVPIILDGDHAREGETIDRWVDERSHVAHAVTVWKALRERNHTLLDTCFPSDPDTGGLVEIVYRPPDGLPPHGSTLDLIYDPDALANESGFESAGRSPGTRGRSAQPIRHDASVNALDWLREIVNNKLADHTSASLQTADGSDSPLPLTLGLHVGSLLGAIWLQIATNTVGSRRFAR